MNREQRRRLAQGLNPGYDARGNHPWDELFVAYPDGSYTCGPCTPDGIDPGDPDVEVWEFWSSGWTGCVMCRACRLCIPVYAADKA